jgi:YjbE family integral membrane protein
VLLIDLLLAGDNALVIALVCQTLPLQRQRMTLILATLGATLARVVLVTITGGLLALPGLKLLGGGLLALLAVNLACPRPSRTDAPPTPGGQTGVLGAALLLTMIDVLMGFDNVLALAAVAGDSTLYLALGLTLSIAILMFGSTLVGRLLHRYPELNRLGIALLGWVAGKMLVSDPLLAGWISQQAPALPLIVPALAALYVYLLGSNTPETAWPDLHPQPAATVKRPPPPLPVPTPAPTPPPTSMPQDTTAEPAVETEMAPSSRLEFWLFAGLFGIVSIIIVLASIFGGAIRF